MTRVDLAPPWRLPRALQLFLTCWLVYALHFATNVVREHYPAFSLAERGTLRVDPYLGLHPDLFELPGRGAFINNNPGASVLAALPYALVRPGVDLVVARVQEQRAREGAPPSAEYDDPRPNRRRFFAQVRERGLDVRFGLATFAIHVLGQAPLAAAAALVMRGVLRRRGLPDGAATLLALLYAFGTPVFFRAGYLSQNLLVAHAALFAFALLDPLRATPGAARTAAAGARPSPGRLAAAGACLGFGVACDYSGIVPLAAIGLYALVRLVRSAGARDGLAGTAWLAAGGAVPLAGLLAYQAWAFGNPLYPAQHWMPKEQYEFAGAGYAGFSWPAADLLLQNLFDPRFGLFVFGPLLLLAFAAPAVARRGRSFLSGGELALAFGLFLGLLLFSSANQYGRLQWNTGVRYLVPAVPLLFLAAAAVLVRLPRQLAAALALLAIAHGWCLAMVREDVPQSLLTVLVAGPQLPWLTVLGKMGGQYVGLLGEARPDPLFFFALTAALLAVLWWPARGPAGGTRG